MLPEPGKQVRLGSGLDSAEHDREAATTRSRAAEVDPTRIASKVLASCHEPASASLLMERDTARVGGRLVLEPGREPTAAAAARTADPRRPVRPLPCLKVIMSALVERQFVATFLIGKSARARRVEGASRAPGLRGDVEQNPKKKRPPLHRSESEACAISDTKNGHVF